MQIGSRIKSSNVVKRIRVMKWKRYALRDMLPVKKIEFVKRHPESTKKIIDDYLKKKSELKKELEDKIEHVLQKTTLLTESGIDKQKLKEDILVCNLVYGYSVNEYMCYDFAHKKLQERRAYISDRESVLLGYDLNDIDEMMIFADKMATYEKFRKYYLREAISISGEEDFKVFKNFVEKHRKFVKKNVLESCGRSVEVINIDEEQKNLYDLFKMFLEEGKIILEEVVKQHKDISIFNESSVNTFRCITLGEVDEIRILYCFMKVGRKGHFIDNGAAGGILVGIDPLSGKLATDGVDECGCRYVQHPDSGVVFQGFQIPEWNNMLNMVIEMSAQIPAVRLIGWDLAYTNTGWVLIEGNAMTEVIGPQGTWMRGIKEEMKQLLLNK